MRDPLFHLVILIALLLSLAANLSGTTSAHSASARWTVVTHPARLVNGMPVLFRVTTPKPVRALSGNWLGHQIAFSFAASHKSWFPPPAGTLQNKPGAPPLH